MIFLKLTLIEGGHMLPITAPERTAQFIRAAAASCPLLVDQAPVSEQMA
jgi:carboxypeptidase C (cathepsin A)